MLRSPHASIQLQSVRPVTKADIATVIDTLRRSGVFPDEADLKPEPICEGGIAIFTEFPKYKTVRFTGASGWPIIWGTEDMTEWATDHTCVVSWRQYASVVRRNNHPDVTLVCKVGLGSERWTREELTTVANALVQCGAFKPRRRNARMVSLRY